MNRDLITRLFNPFSAITVSKVKAVIFTKEHSTRGAKVVVLRFLIDKPMLTLRKGREQVLELILKRMLT